MSTSKPTHERTAGHAPDPHDAKERVGAHGAADHGGDHGHDDHGHGGEALGPIDVRAWLAGLAGVVLGLVIVVALAMASGYFDAAIA